MPTPRIALVVLALLSVGCAALSGSREQYYVCSYDTVWDAALETMKGQSIATYDKEKGLGSKYILFLDLVAWRLRH